MTEGAFAEHHPDVSPPINPWHKDYWPLSDYPTAELHCAEPRQIQEIAETLLQRNHREAVVKGVLGGNFRRVASEVWK